MPRIVTLAGGELSLRYWVSTASLSMNGGAGVSLNDPQLTELVTEAFTRSLSHKELLLTRVLLSNLSINLISCFGNLFGHGHSFSGIIFITLF